MYPGQRSSGSSTLSVAQLLQDCNSYKSEFKAQIAADVTQVTAECPSLHAEMDIHYSNDGTSSTLMTLSGTIPIHYLGSRYNIPVQIWIVEEYPKAPPLVYVTPTGSMAIARDHDYVSASGVVYLPYLNQWNSSRSNLSGLVSSCRAIFSQFPPVLAKPPSVGTSVNPPPPAYSPSSSAYPGAFSNTNSSGGSPYPMMNNDVGNSPYPTASSRTPPPPPYPSASMGMQPPPPIPSRPGSSAQTVIETSSSIKAATQNKKERELKNAKQAVQIKLQEEYRRFREQMRDELAQEIAIQKQLETGQSVLEEGIQKLETQAEEFDNLIHELKTKEAQLKTWLEEYEGDTNSEQDAAMAEISLDEAIVPADAISRQLFDCVAESNAIEDLLFHLDRALSNDVIDTHTFLKEIRKHAAKQFKALALANKIAKHQQKMEMQSFLPPNMHSSPPAYQRQS